jgi:hypothetical protein
MVEIASRFHGVCDSRYFDKISTATDAFRDVYLKDFCEHLGPKIIGRFDPLSILSLVAKLKSFLLSGLRTMSRLHGEWGAKTLPPISTVFTETPYEMTGPWTESDLAGDGMDRGLFTTKWEYVLLTTPSANKP